MTDNRVMEQDTNGRNTMTAFETDVAIAAKLTALRAEVAIAEENYRIAIKHRDEAGARKMTPENHHAYIGASKWVGVTDERRRVARKALINATDPVTNGYDAEPMGRCQ